jgi:hypothetical protein
VEEDLSLTSKRWGLPEVCERKRTPSFPQKGKTVIGGISFQFFHFFSKKESSSILILMEDFSPFSMMNIMAN